MRRDFFFCSFCRKTRLLKGISGSRRLLSRCSRTGMAAAASAGRKMVYKNVNCQIVGGCILSSGIRQAISFSQCLFYCEPVLLSSLQSV